MYKEYCVFGERLKEILNERGMTQREIAEKAGITEASISRYIAFQRVPKVTHVLKIANALNCSCDYLLGK